MPHKQCLNNSQFNVLICNNNLQAEQLCQEIAFYSKNCNLTINVFPDWETLPYDSFSPHQDIVSARLRTLRQLQDGVRGIVLVPINTLMQRLPPVEYIAGRVMTLKTGERLNREAFRESLSRAGYRAVETVYEPGEYAMRGALIGLAIAIPAIACYNILKNKVAKLVLQVGITSEGLMSRFENVGGDPPQS